MNCYSGLCLVDLIIIAIKHFVPAAIRGPGSRPSSSPDPQASPNAGRPTQHYVWGHRHGGGVPELLWWTSNAQRRIPNYRR